MFPSHDRGITVAVGRAIVNQNRKVHVLISDGEGAGIVTGKPSTSLK